MTPNYRLLFSIISMVLSGLVMYRGILFPEDSALIYPWASDTWGHLQKAEFLLEEIGRGNLYPKLFPDWYNGVEFLRYYAPLPYYLLAFFFRLTGNIFIAGNWLIFASTLIGGLSFLLYRRRVGLLPALIGGVLFMLLPDNVRVALGEGNLPRVVAVSLLPVGLFLLFEVLDRGPKSHRVVSLSVVVSLFVLSHAMMGAIFVATLSLLSLVYFVMTGYRLRYLLWVELTLVCGVLLSGWWLLPSLTGGITEINQSAMSEALARFPVTVSLNPGTRAQTLEEFYFGISLVAGTGLGILTWRLIDGFTRSLLLTGMATFLVTTVFFDPVFSALPFSYLFWPLRFSSFAGFALLLGIMAAFARMMNNPSLYLKVPWLLIIGFLCWDFSGSSSLIFLRSEAPDLSKVSQLLRGLPGWRVATLDESLFGSAATYSLSIADREQVYGWGYQGARTGPNVASVNFAVNKGFNNYAIDRLEELGTDDILLMNGNGFTFGFNSELEKNGFSRLYHDYRLSLYHKNGKPRAFQVSYDALGIGEGTQNFGLIFPSLGFGYSANIDDYDLEYLLGFKTLVLSRFSWRDKDKAETIIRSYSEGGGNAIIDLTGVREDTLAKEPKFLGVYGEPVLLNNRVEIKKDGELLQLAPFVGQFESWAANSPQGLDTIIATFDYLGREGVALGYKKFGEGKVWFVGLNLPFHGLLTRDPVAIGLLEDVLGITSGKAPQRTVVPMNSYQATSEGYRFEIEVPRDGDLLVPVAAHEGASVLVDGRNVPTTIIDNLVSASVPSGNHEIRIAFERTKIFWMGQIVSIAIALLLGAILISGFPLLQKRPSMVGELDPTQSSESLPGT